ncbi:zona pellucida sperm-binding protein 3 receptor-like isoform X2 [Rhinoraja longicauda]
MALRLAALVVLAARAAADCGRPPELENGFPVDEFTSETSFKEGAEVIYGCNLGYVFKEDSLNGSRSVTCKEDSTWTTLQLKCELRNCGNPGEIMNGYSQAPNTTLGSKVTFHCETGYQVVGRSYQLCTADGWDGQIPTCQAVTCDELPPIMNGVALSPPNRENWKYGMVTRYSCAENYSLIGANELVCTETGEWNNEPPTCRVQCHPPDVPLNGRIEAGFGPMYMYRDTISYSCTEGFEIVGQSVIECAENSTFVPGPPSCKPVSCSAPPPISNGTAPSAASGEVWEYGMVAEYSCSAGHSLIGAARLVCTETGEWDNTPPTCRAVSCSAPPPISNGTAPSAASGEVWEYGMVAEYSCSAGHSLIGAARLVCTETGEWDNTPPTCRAVLCHAPDVPLNGRMEGDSGPVFVVGDTIIYSCFEGFEMVGQSKIECGENKTFAPGPPSCKLVQCDQPARPAFSQMETGIALTYSYGETIRYSCVQGSQMVGRSTIECRENNTFVPGPPICKPRNCGSPGMILNGYSQAPDTTFGNRASFQCKTGFLMVGKNYRLCTARGWDGKPPGCEEMKPSLPVGNAESGEFIKGPLQSGAKRKQVLGTIGIVAVCITSFCTGIAVTAGVSHIKKKRWCRTRQCKSCKRVHINPQPNTGQAGSPHRSPDMSFTK